jgi:hypothetical protein
MLDKHKTVFLFSLQTLSLFAIEACSASLKPAVGTIYQ